MLKRVAQMLVLVPGTDAHWRVLEIYLGIMILGQERAGSKWQARDSALRLMLTLRVECWKWVFCGAVCPRWNPTEDRRNFHPGHPGPSW